MTISNEKNNDRFIEFLNERYVDYININDAEKSEIPDIIIKSLISLVETLESLDYYDEKTKIIRQFVAIKLFDELEKYAPDKQSANHLLFSKKIDAFLFCYKLFLNISESDFDNRDVYIKVNECKSRAKIKQDFSYLPEIIVSLTSFPERIDKVYKSLNSIFTQSFKPDRIILWLAEEQFPEKELPASLVEYVKLGLEIRWCKEDLRSHKKYYYVMQEYPNAIIVTVDDDLVYPDYMIELLVTSYLHFPNAVSAVRTHLMMLDNDGKVTPYYKWPKEFSGVLCKPSMQLFATSGAGTLYPPECMDKEVFNMENIKSLAPNADDMWLKVMQLKNGTPVVLAKRNKDLVFVPETQEVALYHSNVRLNENDIQLNNIFKEYDKDNALVKSIDEGYTADSNIVGIELYDNNDYGTLNAVRTQVSGNVNLEHELVSLKEKHSELNKIHKDLLENYSRLMSKCTMAVDNMEMLKAHLKKTEAHSRRVNKELTDIKNSVSFKLGRFLTYIPRKIRGGIKCYLENGLKYTVNNIFKKIKNKLK